MTTFASYLPPDDIDNLIAPICELADMELSEEGNHVDLLMDQVILAARAVRDREGFLVVDDEEINATLGPTDTGSVT